MSPGQTDFKYSAFLSYSHADRPFGEWLQKSLERYVIPADLAGRTVTPGSVKGTLRPVFRDRWDLSAGHSLNEEIEAALRQSRYLIVLCSPNSTKSAYVNEEIHRFKALGRERQILSIIVDGEPGDKERECFPEALRFDRQADGRLVRTAHEPIAADARPEGDGRELAKLKLIAGMLGVPLDGIRRREEIEQQRRLRKARLVAGAMAALALVAVAGAGVAWWQYGVANEQRVIAEVRRVEAEKRYDEALDSTLRFVTTSATFRTLLERQKGRLIEFGLEQRQMKGASDDFQRFIREGNSKEIWLRLVRVLLRYEQDLPEELDRYHEDLNRAKLPVQWVRHAELITTNLKRQYGDSADYAAALDTIKEELNKHGEELTPPPVARDCGSPGSVRPMPNVAMNAAPNVQMNAAPNAVPPAASKELAETFKEQMQMMQEPVNDPASSAQPNDVQDAQAEIMQPQMQMVQPEFAQRALNAPCP